jgi:hypothetical protein
MRERPGVGAAAVLDERPSMVTPAPAMPPDPKQYRAALSRWDNEGGNPDLPWSNVALDAAEFPLATALSQAELIRLRVRVIALENLVIGLLAQAPLEQGERVRRMADYIAPREGYTPHPLTTQAGAQMVHLADRAGHFRSNPPPI